MAFLVTKLWDKLASHVVLNEVEEQNKLENKSEKKQLIELARKINKSILSLYAKFLSEDGNACERIYS
jgi:hypothetical protein